MVIQLHILVVGMTMNGDKLIGHIAPAFHIVGRKMMQIFSIESGPHIQTIQPHLIGIDILMIETALAIFFLNTRIFVAQIMVKIIGSRFVFGRIGIALRRSLRQFAVVKFEENLTRSNVVDITFFEIPETTVAVERRIGISLTPSISPLCPVVFGILRGTFQDRFRHQTAHIIPRFHGRPSFALRKHHTLRVIAVFGLHGFLLGLQQIANGSAGSVFSCQHLRHLHHIDTRILIRHFQVLVGIGSLAIVLEAIVVAVQVENITVITKYTSISHAFHHIIAFDERVRIIIDTDGLTIAGTIVIIIKNVDIHPIGHR